MWKCNNLFLFFKLKKWIILIVCTRSNKQLLQIFYKTAIACDKKQLDRSSTNALDPVNLSLWLGAIVWSQQCFGGASEVSSCWKQTFAENPWRPANLHQVTTKYNVWADERHPEWNRREDVPTASTGLKGRWRFSGLWPEIRKVPLEASEKVKDLQEWRKQVLVDVTEQLSTLIPPHSEGCGLLSILRQQKVFVVKSQGVHLFADFMYEGIAPRAVRPSKRL